MGTSRAVKLTLTILRLLALASIPLAIGSSGLQGIVACFAADGGFALEAGDETGCFCPPPDHAASREGLSAAVSRVDADCAADCVCVPFTTDWKTSFSRSVTRDDRRGEPLPQWLSQVEFEPRTFAASTDRVLSREHASPPTPFFRLALRSIVLLT